MWSGFQLPLPATDGAEVFGTPTNELTLSQGEMEMTQPSSGPSPPQGYAQKKWRGTYDLTTRIHRRSNSPSSRLSRTILQYWAPEHYREARARKPGAHIISLRSLVRDSKSSQVLGCPGFHFPLNFALQDALDLRSLPGKVVIYYSPDSTATRMELMALFWTVHILFVLPERPFLTHDNSMKVMRVVRSSHAHRRNLVSFSNVHL